MGLISELKKVLEVVVPADANYVNKGTLQFPDGAAPVTATTGAAAIGSYAELVAAASMTSNFWLEGIFAETDEAEVGTIQIGTGASGSESVIATIVVSKGAATNLSGSWVTLQHPIFIPSGTRIAARFWTTTDGGTAQVKITGRTGL